MTSEWVHLYMVLAGLLIMKVFVHAIPYSTVIGWLYVTCLDTVGNIILQQCNMIHVKISSRNCIFSESKRSSPKQTSKPTVDSPTKHKLGEKTSANGVATHQSLKENDSSTNSQVAETKLLLCHSICAQTTENRV